ncbi:MAG TPA: DegT/DnrJ/EryC1/StrS family aminotransferase [Gemmatimonadaceae bacterium]|nr:DegT/DnrJ/EryC1/StrS family aminotransferase [Gemmatimonadaceae bacterium]
MSRKRIHLSVPHMGGEERRFVSEAFETNWLSTIGPNVDGFERELAERLGDGVHALAVSSGTAALHLVLRALGVGRGDRVAVSTLTFAGSVWPVLYLGAEPVFVDSETASWNVDPGLLHEYLHEAARRGTLPKAFIAVHLYGQHADLDPILEICRTFGVMLVEDAAESLGATYRGRQTATVADYSILSFNGNKIITTTGGGAVVARDRDVLARMKKWANQSREPAVEYLHAEYGFNYRMSNVLAGIGRGQLRVLDERVARRRAIFDRYREAFADLAGLVPQPEAPWGRHTRWLSVFSVDPEEVPVTPEDIVRELDREDIEARPVWRPMHMQPVFEGAHRVRGEVAQRLYETGICLPSSSSLSEEEQRRVVDAVRSVVSATVGRTR